MFDFAEKKAGASFVTLLSCATSERRRQARSLSQIACGRCDDTPCAFKLVQRVIAERIEIAIDA
jgi:hypothetical protein